MKAALILVLLASLVGCNRGIDTPDGEVRVTKTELLADHNLQNNPEVCWITAAGRQGSSRIEYRAVNYDGNCPEIQTVVVDHDGVLIKKGDPAFANGGSFWAAFVKSTKEIQ
jgi:hypothetical protein